MRTTSMICGALLALAAGTASAVPGLNVRWNTCFGDGGAFSRTFACNTNAGTSVVVVGFELGADKADVSGAEMVLDLCVDGPALPAWWTFLEPGSCRTGALTFDTAIPAGAFNCFDWGNGNAAPVAGSLAYVTGLQGARSARIVAASAVPSSALQVLYGSVEYFAFRLIMDHTATVGSPSCAGCLSPVALLLQSVRLVTPDPAGHLVVSGPTNGNDSDTCRWQGAGPPWICGLTPARRSSWGAVKSLYR